jgi:uncharacterized protein (DUF849 family)
VEAIVYATIPPSDTLGRPPLSARERFEPQAELGDRGLLEMMAIDPGTVVLNTYENIAAGESVFVNRNDEAVIRTGLSVANRYGAAPAYAIYGPSFIRTGAALAAQYPDISPPVYRFMFSENYTMSHPPEPYALDSYCELLEREAPGANWMKSGLGVDLIPLIPEAVDRGGHVRVGLEDAPLGSDRSNLEWVEHARTAIEDAGGRVASAAAVRRRLLQS